MTAPTEPNYVIGLEIDVICRMIEQFERLRDSGDARFDKKQVDRVMEYIMSYCKDTLNENARDEQEPTR